MMGCLQTPGLSDEQDHSPHLRHSFGSRKPAPGASKHRAPGLVPGVGGWNLVQTGIFPTHLRSQGEASPSRPTGPHSLQRL